MFNVEEIVQHQKPLSEWQIKNLHSLILKNINDQYAGVYRNEHVYISGAEHIPTAPYLIKEKIAQEVEDSLDLYLRAVEA